MTAASAQSATQQITAGRAHIVIEDAIYDCPFEPDTANADDAGNGAARSGLAETAAKGIVRIERAKLRELATQCTGQPTCRVEPGTLFPATIIAAGCRGLQLVFTCSDTDGRVSPDSIGTELFLAADATAALPLSCPQPGPDTDGSLNLRPGADLE